MTASEGNGDDGYIRGGGGFPIPGRVVLAIVLAVIALGLAATAIGLAAGGHDRRQATAALRSKGVPVSVKVTSCRAASSGIGMGIEYWSCQGTYRLSGNTYTEPIHGDRKLLDAGSTLTALAVPGRPDLLTLPEAVQPVSWWSAYAAATVAAAATAVAAGAAAALAAGRSVRQRPAVRLP